MKIIQHTIGLKFILIANAIDSILDMVSGYIQGIYQSWKMSKSIARRVKQHFAGNHMEQLEKDMLKARKLLSRLLSLHDSKDDSLFSQEEYQKLMLMPSFALKLALETRGILDDLKRDLSFVNMKQATTTAKISLKNFLLSFIPNPIVFLARWKDLFVFIFFMKYSRLQVRTMYSEMAGSCEKILDDPEQELHIKKARHQLQRLLQMLCKPGPILYPRLWSRYELVCEAKWQYPQAQLELERWLTLEVKRTLKKKGQTISQEEQLLRLQEQRDFFLRYRWQCKLSEQFLLKQF